MTAHPLSRLREETERFGVARALVGACFVMLNRIMLFDRLNIIMLDRDHVRPVKARPGTTLTTRLATRAELEALCLDPAFAMGDLKLGYFDAGDSCLLSFADDELAGYTWVHERGCPMLVPGLVISVPGQFLYNFSAFTLERFRGLGLQPYRHNVILGMPQWQDRHALLGFVRYTNWSSRKGQDKSGYREIGHIWLIGSQRRFGAWFSRSLRKLGIRRLPQPA